MTKARSGINTNGQIDRPQKPVAKGREERRVLRAKPLKGKIDHEALSREFMARFPKIRAALAK
jgi:hypothetical protein